MSGLLPRELDLAPMLAEAKRQLVDATDYLREGEQMTLFGRLLADNPTMIVPAPDAEFTSVRVLAMGFIEGQPIKTLVSALHATHDVAMRSLIGLMLRKLFEFGTIKTDPNFANYRFQPDSDRLALIDFGAVRGERGDRKGLSPTSLSGTRSARDSIGEAATVAGFTGSAVVARRATRIA